MMRHCSASVPLRASANSAAGAPMRAARSARACSIAAVRVCPAMPSRTNTTLRWLRKRVCVRYSSSISRGITPQ